MLLIGEIDPLLKTVCDPFDFENPPFDPIEFSQELVKFMRDNDGIGLAANQVGVTYRIFAMRSDPNRVCFNPRIVWTSDETIVLEEGCLSFPGLIVKIKRPKHIKIRYTQPNSETVTETFTGMAARVAQHEMDHLNGIIFYNLANRYHRDFAFKHRAKNVKRMMGTPYVMSREQPTQSPTETPVVQPVGNDVFYIIPPITTNEGLKGNV